MILTQEEVKKFILDLVLTDKVGAVCHLITGEERGPRLTCSACLMRLVDGPDVGKCILSGPNRSADPKINYLIAKKLLDRHWPKSRLVQLELFNQTSDSVD